MGDRVGLTWLPPRTVRTLEKQAAVAIANCRGTCDQPGRLWSSASRRRGRCPPCSAISYTGVVENQLKESPAHVLPVQRTDQRIPPPIPTTPGRPDPSDSELMRVGGTSTGPPSVAGRRGETGLFVVTACRAHGDHQVCRGPGRPPVEIVVTPGTMITDGPRCNRAPFSKIVEFVER